MAKKNLASVTSSHASKTKLSAHGLDVPAPDEVKEKKGFLDGRLPVRFSNANSEKLARHFKKKGLSLSAGIRMVISEYMERENIF